LVGDVGRGGGGGKVGGEREGVRGRGVVIEGVEKVIGSV